MQLNSPYPKTATKKIDRRKKVFVFLRTHRGELSFNKKSPPSSTRSKITLIASDSSNSSNPNDFNRVYVVRTKYSRG